MGSGLYLIRGSSRWSLWAAADLLARWGNLKGCPGLSMGECAALRLAPRGSEAVHKSTGEPVIQGGLCRLLACQRGADA